MFNEWILNGEKRREAFEKELTPQGLFDELADYKKCFGDEFGIKELLYLWDIRSKAMIAEAINDAPEFLMDQVGKMRNSYSVDCIPESLRMIANAIEGTSNEF